MIRDKKARAEHFKKSVVEALKRLIAPAVFILIIAIAAFALSRLSKKEDVELPIDIRSFDGSVTECVLENDQLRFELNPDNTQFTVTDKKTGEVWYSNPPDVTSESATIASDVDRIKSTLILTYSTVNGVDTFLDNYKYSMETKLYNIEKGSDFVKVNYTIGQVEKEFIIPRVITVAYMNELLAKVSKSNVDTIKQYYKKYDINKLGKNDNKEELLEKYPILETEPIYVLRDGTKDGIKTKIELWLGEAGYSRADYDLEAETYHFEITSEKPIYNVSVVYKLEGNDLVVSIPMSEIEYKEKYPLISINVLPFFGAGGREEKGYLLVPEGGGSIINFNNGKVKQNPYYANVYGWDNALGRTYLVHETKAYFGVFGVAKEKSSFICILEEGAPYASISADISKNIKYNYVSASYTALNREQVDVATKYNGAMFVYEDGLPNETITQRYRFVGSNSYVDMANEYNRYLSDKYGSAFAKNDDSSLPVAVEIVGAVDKIKQVFGIPVSKPLNVTSFSEAQNILASLNSHGVENMSVKLSGWINGGVKQKVLSKYELVKGLGGQKELNNLISYAKQIGADFYLNGVTSYAYDSDFFDGFVSSRDAAKLVNRKRVVLEPYDPIYYGAEGEEFYLLKPSLILTYMQNLEKAADKYGANGVSYEDIGFKLSSDFYRKNPVSRQAAMLMQVDQLVKTKAAGKKVMTNLGNDYVLGTSDMITNMDLAGSLYSIIDETVPFYQMAIHGYVNYTGEPLNLTENYKEELLKSVEYGAGLNVTFMNAEITELQNTTYSQYYGANYAGWEQIFVDIYTRYNKELGHTFNQRMVNHNMLEEGITVTEYEDGTKVYVNYRFEEYKKGSVSIPARDYTVIKK